MNIDNGKQLSRHNDLASLTFRMVASYKSYGATASSFAFNAADILLTASLVTGPAAPTL
jgi:hypothetical protein